jgi:hypothetical protein
LLYAYYVDVVELFVLLPLPHTLDAASMLSMAVAAVEKQRNPGALLRKTFSNLSWAELS